MVGTTQKYHFFFDAAPNIRKRDLNEEIKRDKTLKSLYRIKVDNLYMVYSTLDNSIQNLGLKSKDKKVISLFEQIQQTYSQEYNQPPDQHMDI